MGFLLAIESTILIIVDFFSLILGYIILRSNTKSSTNRIFAFLTIVMSAWAVVIHFSLQPDSSGGLMWIRISIFLATIMSALFFLLAHTFPAPKLNLRNGSLILFIIVTISIMLVTISPYAFTGVQMVGNTITPIPGFGLILFGLFVVLTSGGAVFILWQRQNKAEDNIKKQLSLVMKGILLMYALMIFLIFLPLALLKITTLVPLFPAFTLVFTGMTAYAIVRYRLFNLKIITVEAITVVLWVMLFAKVFTSDINESIINALIFISSLVFGVLLIRSVRKEVKQREQLEILDKELEAANEQLKILDKARADFITIASHQLRTPPATIKWYLSSILEGDYGKMDDNVHVQLRRTMSTNNSMISLIDDLLNASRIERGKMEFIFQPTDLVEITQITVDQLEPQAEMRKLNLVFQKPKEALPVITADKEKLRQVMNNLIDNAIKYTQQGKIEVSITKTAKDLVFKVSDSGKGIPPGQMKAIFEKYDRGKSAARNSTGLGLGLYVAKVIVEQHKGKIWAESKGEGKGSSFIFTVPIKSNLSKSEFDLTKGQETTKKAS
jgi:signal transduction histidine kinase